MEVQKDAFVLKNRHLNWRKLILLRNKKGMVPSCMPYWTAVSGSQGNFCLKNKYEVNDIGNK